MLGPRQQGPPPTRVIQDWQAAELQAVGWMRFLGHLDAAPTTRGADNGLDVMSQTGVAQVKAWMKPVGREPLQRLMGAAHRCPGRALYFFSLAGYSAPAARLGEEVGMRLYTLDVATGGLVPYGRAARADLDAAIARYRQASEGGPTAPQAHAVWTNNAHLDMSARARYRATWGFRAAQASLLWLRTTFRNAVAAIGKGRPADLLRVLVAVLCIEAVVVLGVVFLVAGVGEMAWRNAKSPNR